MMQRWKKVAIAVAAVALGTTTAYFFSRSSAPRARLVLFVVVDQFAAHTAERIRPSLTGGLGRLMNEGAWFTDAHHDHLVTETCPGHATLATGSFPSHSGIVGNDYFDREFDREVPCTFDQDFGNSPRSLKRETLADWIRRADSGARAYAVAGKARSAIMLAGKKGNGAYWYNSANGKFATSDFYPETARDVIADFKSVALLDMRFGTSWTPLERADAVPLQFELETDRHGMVLGEFPHQLGSASLRPNADFYASIYESPFVDHVTAAAARHVVERERLGQRDSLDFLGLSFSALDIVGHRYGPNSLEVFDTLLRLDQELGSLLDYLELAVGKEHLVVVLSADHGIPPLPETLARHGEKAERQDAEGIACLQKAGMKLSADFNVSFGDSFTLDNESWQRLGSRRAEYESAARALLERCRGIARVWTAQDFALPPETVEGQRALQSFFPERGTDLLIQLKPYFAAHPLHGVNHGTPYDYDTRVPVIIRANEIDAKTIPTAIRTVDVAPTLAELLSVSASECDGVSQLAMMARP